MNLMVCKNKILSKSEVQQYHEEGWIGPFKLISPTEMVNISHVIQKQIIEPVKQQNLEENDYLHNRHLDNQGIWELFSNPELAERVASILGPHLVLWRLNFQLKPPLSDQKEWNYGWDTSFPWHQDCAYFQPSPNVILSAWIAVDEVNKDNGCIRIIPGSHK
jgi:non-heme Fe2+,alpha-ketoglutarate-dependent halogenase